MRSIRLHGVRISAGEPSRDYKKDIVRENPDFTGVFAVYSGGFSRCKEQICDFVTVCFRDLGYSDRKKEVLFMKILGKKAIKHILFTAGGALIGLIYYKAVGCASGTCMFTSSIGGSMLYGGLWGLLLSWITSGGCCCGSGACNVERSDED